jgi:hypothetical protein
MVLLGPKQVVIIGKTEINIVLDGIILYIYSICYVCGHYPSSRFYMKRRPVYISKHNASETGLRLRLQGNPTQLGPTDRAHT